MDKEISPIYLFDGSIARWKRPLKAGAVNLIYMEFDALTEIKQWLGFNFVNEATFGDYRVTASASKFLAMVAPFGKEGRYLMGRTKLSNEPQPRILFSGGIEIYHCGKIPGTEITGYDSPIVGKIWTAQEPSETLENQKGLQTLIFGQGNDKQKAARLQAIIRGYEEQDRQLFEGQLRALQRM